VSTSENKRRVRDYFDAMGRGDSSLPDLLTEDVTWWAPPSSELGGIHEGRDAVLRLMGSGVGLYDRDTPMQVDIRSMVAEGDRVCVEVDIRSMVAEGDRVCVEMTLEARTARGEHYLNHYHFAFRLRDGRICEVREHLDTLYAQRKLF
jgi:ketosteroid isomerase-like protein